MDLIQWLLGYSQPVIGFLTKWAGELVAVTLVGMVGIALRWFGDADRAFRCRLHQRELRQANEILRKASAYFAQAELAADGREEPAALAA